DRWLADRLPVRIRVAGADRWTRLMAGPTDPEERWAAARTVLVRDAGFTEVQPGTVTVAASLPGIEP
ncbi:MAG TPA: peptidyl-tRNA hydrolase, partial [Mycobacteriales bacterium]|nr:peptidyl-tRNA hydrolase [Mycobacteriales bacterium]